MMAREKKIPAALKRALSDIEMDASELRDYIAGQRRAFDSIKRTNGDFTAWVQLKLSCNRKMAQAAIDWAEAA